MPDPLSPDSNLVLLALFWACVATILYAYIGYPLVVYLRSRYVVRPVAKAPFTPPVSILMAVHNEEKRLKAKLENLLQLTYPKSRLEILIISDDSSDGTADLVASYADQGIKLHTVKPRQGKHFAQQVGLELTQSDIVVFTDAAPHLAPDALANLIQNFADPLVGCAGGEDRILDVEGSTNSEGAYIRYDMAIRRMESRMWSSVGLSGAFFAVRREICDPWFHDRSSDLHLPLEAVRRGYRAISDPASIHYYGTTSSTGGEFHRKSRTIVNGLLVFFTSFDLLNPFRYGFFSHQLMGHKLCRWMVPWALLGLALTTFALSRSGPWYTMALWSQAICYLLAAFGLKIPSLQRMLIVRVPAFFVLTNAAIAVAWFRFLTGRTHAIWTPTPRP